ncbi:hypothetical protein SS1G_13119 [Sclerotinia sclerotiorum 1980 UF-70]|uniref:Uncharacterized protein n=1 Tax=Sclerotinia sclerotiorum (strain ATCC 18683 / 1980 / Ss-1) TaxID=665079 RepID=A7F690_SCLS1|nr:hypothetical protein SS1G_13119 [Sclerotinia sclerotiorum 1980 UF-70]EDN98261.1 hypothetical protein SS1G_13119 [Sclerotinia sclerotiorum 1980 UF-70]
MSDSPIFTRNILEMLQTSRRHPRQSSRCAWKATVTHFFEGWSGWPKDENQGDILSWFAEISEKLAAFAEDYKSTPTRQRRPLAQLKKSIDGSIAERKIAVGFVNDPQATKDSKCSAF